MQYDRCFRPSEIARHSTDPLVAEPVHDARRSALALMDRASGRVVPLHPGRRTRVGAAPDNDLVLEDRAVSAYHASIEPDGLGGLVLSDLRSTNGTFVHGLRVTRVELRAGVSVSMGRSVLRVIEDRPPESLEEQIGIIGSCPAMQRVRRDVLRYAPLEATVLVRGETGTGKEVVARALHAQSARAGAPLVAFNAAALDPHLVDSELFGHERGAFTGALVRHRGLFEQANGGTLFVDEVAELSAPAQARLLRVLETGELRPVGTERSIAVRVRVLAATHRDLVAMVRAKTFRVDLYYRLNALVIDLPPLRERVGDLPGLASHLLARIADGRAARWQLRDEALDLLSRYAWPGNVRQLSSVLHRATMLTSGAWLGADVILEALRGEPDGRLVAPRAQPIVERPDDATIRSIVQACDGRLSPAARQLGMPRTTLRELVRKLGIQAR